MGNAVRKVALPLYDPALTKITARVASYASTEIA